LVLGIKGRTYTTGISEWVLGRTFEQKRDETMKGLRRLHNEEFHNLYFSPNIIRMNNSKRII
jgi:hypothetical protein